MYVDYAVLGAFTLLWLAIVPTPGPNTLLIVHLALTASWRSVGWALAGNLLGILAYALCTLFGLALLLAAAPSVRLAVYVLGGAYLAWVGMRMWLAGLARRRTGANDTLGGVADTEAEARPFLRGLMTALSNVQALFFLTGIFAGVGVLAASGLTQLAAIGVIMACNGGYLCLLAWLLQRERPRALYARYRTAMEMGFGVLFVMFGVRLILRELAGWL